MNTNMAMAGNFFNAGPFMPHGDSYLWVQSLIALHAVSDGVIVLAYYSIPFLLLYFVRRRMDIDWKFKSVALCLALFVLACGTTHLLEIWNIWHADYWLAGLVKAFTAVVSVLTLILFIKSLSPALTLPSAADLQKAHDELDLRVRERTAELEEKSAVLLESQRMANLGSYVLDLASGRWSSSEVLDQVFGISPAYDRSVAGWAALIHPADHTMMVDYLEKEVIGRHQPFDKEYRIIRQNDQAERWVRGHGKLKFDAQGRPVKLIGTIQDITERKQTEAALVRERRLLSTLVEHLPVNVFLKDTAGRKTLSNPLDVRLCGAASEADVLGKTDAELFGQELAAGYQADDQRVLTTGQPIINREEQAIGADGSIHWNLTSKVPLFDAAGQVTGLAGIGLDITERKLAEDLRHQSEERYRSLFENTQDAIFTIAADGTFTSLNPAVATIAKISLADWLGKPFAPMVHPDDLPLAMKMFQRILKGEPAPVHELRGNPSLPRPALMEMTLSPQKDNTGKIIGILGIGRDITERKQAELALQESQTLYHSLVDELPAGIFRKDPAGRYVFVSPWFCQLKGMKAEEFLGRTAEEVAGSATAQSDVTERATKYAVGAEDQHQLIMRTGKPVELVEEYRMADGGKQFVRVVKTPLIAPDGKIIGTQGIMFDITESRRAGESNARLATAVEQATENIVITDTAGKILYTNPAFEKTSGYACAEALGQNPRILKSGRHDVGFYRQMWDVLKRGEVWHGHFFNKRKDGSIYEEDATISPVRDAAGKVVNYVAVKRDVTREAQLEAQFRQSQKMEAIGTLAGGVAHDFNNILQILSLDAGLLHGSGGLTPEQEKYTAEISTTVERAAALTRQLLLFSRREVLQPRDLDWSEAVTNTTKMLRRTLGENIAVQLNLAAEPMFIRADPGMMDQVLLNLAVNARDAMPKGGQLIIGTAGVELDELAAAQSAQARPGTFVCLSVTDTGGGIPPEILPKIFEPFFTTKDIGKGTGLGLATVFGIVQQHQGWIEVGSEVGRGTTFKVFLPRLVGMSNQIIAQKMLATIPTGTETLLLVEDESALRATVCKTLTKLGYRVLEASTGVKALEVWQAHRDEIHLLLTDLMMPDGMTGKELAQRLIKKNPKLKVIYMSGYSADLIGKDFPVQAGVNFLPKPFHAQQLAQTIRDSLNRPASS